MNNKIYSYIFNKIPNIYSHLFLNLFGTYYRHIQIDLKNNNDTNLTIVLEKTLINYKKLDYSFYYKELNKTLKNYNPIIIKELSLLLKNDIDTLLILDIIDKKYTDHYKILKKYNLNNRQSIYIYKIFINYLISKTLIKVIKILKIYNNNNIEFKNKINKDVEKYRNIENNMKYVEEGYNNKYKNIINKNEYKILIYLLSISKNSKELNKKYNYNIKRIIQSIGTSTENILISNYYRANNKIEIYNNRYNNKLFNIPEYPYIYKNVKTILKILFQKYHDDIFFLSKKEIILRNIFNNYIRKLNIKDQIKICSQFIIWDLQWDKYEKEFLYKVK